MLTFEMVMSVEGMFSCEVSLEASCDLSMEIAGSLVGPITGCLLSLLVDGDSYSFIIFSLQVASYPSQLWD